METLAPKAWQYGILGVVALAFAYAIIHLFRELRTESKRIEEAAKAHERERSAWKVRETQLELDYARRERELLEHYTEQLNAERASNREHEDEVRQEFAEIMDKVEAENTKTSDRLVEMLQKFYDRLVGPSRGRY